MGVVVVRLARVTANLWDKEINAEGSILVLQISKKQVLGFVFFVLSWKRE